MTYRILPQQLHSIADSAKAFCREQWGISTNRIKDEEAIIDSIGYVTTLHAIMKDYHWLCIEVSENPFPAVLNEFILDCKTQALPVRLYVAIPGSSISGPELARGKRQGVGLMQVVDGETTIVQDALSLALTGLRSPDPRDFPPQYRQTISDAVATFRNGNPSKACAVLYEEIESVSRRIAAKALKKGCWNSKGGGPPSGNIDAMPWANLLRMMMERFDPRQCNSPDLTSTLFGRLIGATPHRNESAHKPRSQSALKKRDSELRTRFESGSDLLRDLIRAARPLRI